MGPPLVYVAMIRPDSGGFSRRRQRRREHLVAIGLGSNQGRREWLLRDAVQGLRLLLSDIRVSGVYETSPAHVTDQPDFLNACCSGSTALGPRQLLSALKDLERAAGRTPGGVRFGPRRLDLDLLLYGASVVNSPDLVIPHPRLRERAFALVPLAEIADGWIVPGTGEAPPVTVGELAARVDTAGIHSTGIRLDE